MTDTRAPEPITARTAGPATNGRPVRKDEIELHDRGLYIESWLPERRSRRKPLLLVHGELGGSWVWERYLGYFAGRGWEGHALNLRNHHWSATADPAELSFESYTEDVVAFMEQVAAGVAIAVENGINRDQAQRYEDELREERDRLRFLLDINNLLVSQRQYPALLEAICAAVQRIVDADHIGVALYDRESRQLTLDLIYEKARGFTKSSTVIDMEKSAAGETFRRGEAGVFRRAEMERLGWHGASIMKTAGVESMCCVPLMSRQRKLGALYVGGAKPDAFSPDDVTLLGQASAQIAIALENARAYEEIATLNARVKATSPRFAA